MSVPQDYSQVQRRRCLLRFVICLSLPLMRLLKLFKYKNVFTAYHVMDCLSHYIGLNLTIVSTCMLVLLAYFNEYRYLKKKELIPLEPSDSFSVSGVLREASTFLVKGTPYYSWQKGYENKNPSVFFVFVSQTSNICADSSLTPT